MDRLLANAGAVFESAMQTALQGSNPGCWTILVGSDEGLVLVQGNHVPLEALRLERRASEAFRVRPQGGSIQVEACSRDRRFTLNGPAPAMAAAPLPLQPILYELVQPSAYPQIPERCPA